MSRPRPRGLVGHQTVGTTAATNVSLPATNGKRVTVLSKTTVVDNGKQNMDDTEEPLIEVLQEVPTDENKTTVAVINATVSVTNNGQVHETHL